MARTILHVDVDNFYVAVERADDPLLEGLPVAVVQQNSGGIVALSNEAKAAGLRKGDGVGAQGRAKISFLVEMGSMSMEECRKRCPQLVIKPMRVERYREFGVSILHLLQRWTDLVEKTSYDDFYMDVTAATAKSVEALEALSLACDSKQLPPRASVASCSGCSVSFDGLPVELQHSCKIAADLRAAMRKELGLAASVGVGRTKLSARMLSPLAKPDGILVLPDSLSVQFFSQCKLLQIPSFQAQRGRAIAEKFVCYRQSKYCTTASSSDVSEGTVASKGQTEHVDCVTLDKLKGVTLGDLASLGQARLAELIGQKDSQRIIHFANGGNDGNAPVLPRGPPKSLASEASFPPVDDGDSLQVKLQELATILWQRLLADSVVHNFRSPRRLVVTWRRGYADNMSLHPTLSTVSPSKGVQHSRGIPWPPGLVHRQRIECSESHPATPGHCAPQVRAQSESVKGLVAPALCMLLSAVAAPRQITRLILSAEFGTSSCEHRRVLGGGSEQATKATLHKFICAQPKKDTMPCKIVNLDSDASSESRSCLSVPPLPCAACEVDVGNVDLATLAELPPSIRVEIERQMSSERWLRQQSKKQSEQCQQSNPSMKRKPIDLKDFFSSKRSSTLGQKSSELVVVDD